MTWLKMIINFLKNNSDLVGAVFGLRVNFYGRSHTGAKDDAF